jgi:hypothetical protein
MSDDLTRRKPEDPNKININQSWEVDYWTKTLGASEARLKEAVKAVGPMVSDVKRYLGI